MHRFGAFRNPEALRPQVMGPLCPDCLSWEPCHFTKGPDCPRFIFLMFSGSRKKEPKCACLSETKASHQQRMWAEVSSSATHFLHSGLSVNLNKWRCLHRVICLVRSPVTILDCILLKNRSLILVPWQGPEISSRACFWVLPRFCQCLQCWLPNQQLILFLRSCLENPQAGSGPINPRAEPHLVSSSAVSLPLTTACPGTQYSPTACRAEM
jgi:hypothetical protein